VKPVRARSLFRQLEPSHPASRRAVESPLGRPRRGAQSSLRVLLAEDNEINALLALKFLEKLGARADLARNGAEAVALAEASVTGERPAYDLVLMDIRMPELDGVEATRRLRALENTLGGRNRLRIVALTASMPRSGEASLRAAGFDAFLQKPFDLSALEALLDDAEEPLAAAS
jgi:CheY-like chemotaxis protein